MVYRKGEPQPPRTYTVKGCGRRHAVCRDCQPEQGGKVSATRLAAHYGRGAPLSLEHRLRISAGVIAAHRRRGPDRFGQRPVPPRRRRALPPPPPPPSLPADRFGQPAKPLPTGVVTFVFARGPQGITCPGNEYHVVLDGTGEEVFARGRPAVRDRVKLGDRVRLSGGDDKWVEAVAAPRPSP